MKILNTTDEENVSLFLKLIDLTLTISQKYNEDLAYKAGLKGLCVGLKTALKCKSYEKDFGLSNYLAWYIKTSIEYELGYENEDTKIWKEKV